MDSIQDLSTQIHDLDQSLEEKDNAVWTELKRLGGLVGTLQMSVNEMLKVVQHTNRVTKDMAFDTKEAVKEVKEAIS